MSKLMNEERLNLDRLVQEYDADDNTSKIREIKHSKKIREDVERLLNLKKKYSRMELTDKKKFEQRLISHCNFLWTNYTNIFNRLVKNELNVNILNKFLDKLQEIEEGETDQHTASVEIGKILKEMYIDSALRHEKKVEASENGGKAKKERKPVTNITWKKYKEAMLNT
jgi:hypothetical protein